MGVDLDIIINAIDQASGPIEGVGGAMSGLASIAGGVLTAGLAAAAAGLAALGTGLGVSLAAAMDNEKIQAELAQTIKSTGGAAGLTADAANDLAQQFMNLAGGSDDAIIAIETIGLRAGTISANEMPAFIQATLDLGTVMGDTAMAAALLARAQDDPEAAFKRIERATGAYDSALEEQIKMLVAAGDNAGAVALIMDKLAETTGGAAAAQAETLAGKWEILKGTLAEAAESIGGPLLTAGQRLFDEFLAPAIPLITEFGAAIAAALGGLLEGDIGGAFDALMEFDGVRAVFQGLGIDVSGLGSIIEDLVEQAKTTAGNFLTAIQPIIDAAGNMLKAFQDSMPMIQKYVADMAAFVLGQINTLSPVLIANVATMLNQLTIFWEGHGEQIMQVVNFAWRTITVTIGGTLTLLTGLIAAGMQAINGDWSGAWETMKGTLRGFMDAALAIVNTNWPTFQKTWANNFQMLSDITIAALNNLSTSLNTWLNTTSASMIVTWTGIWDNLKTIALTLLQPVIDAVVYLYDLIAHVPNVGSMAAPGNSPGSSSNNTTNNSSNSNTTNNYYGVGADTAAGLAQSQAGAF